MRRWMMFPLVAVLGVLAIGVAGAFTSSRGAISPAPPHGPMPLTIPCTQAYENGAWQAPVPDKKGADPALCMEDMRKGVVMMDPANPGQLLKTADGTPRRYSKMPPALPPDVAGSPAVRASQRGSAAAGAQQAAHDKFGGPIIDTFVEVAPAN